MRLKAPTTIDDMLARAIPEPNSGCWLWAGTASSNGYGKLRKHRSTIGAHRAAFELATGKEIPPNMEVCHRCDVRCCVNPDHLFLGSRADNMRDCVSKGRKKSKLTPEQVIAIRTDGRSLLAIATAYGVTRRNISHILQRRTWRHI